MLFNVKEIAQDNEHKWAVVHCLCDLNDEDDLLLNYIIDMLQAAYGENEIMAYAQQVSEPDPLVAKAFDLGAIQKAFRMGLPNPQAEGKKPPSLANYRSESAELLAQASLAATYNIQFPTSPQRGKTNANQPILGFDGFGFVELQKGEWALALLQVKGTEDPQSPPRIAAKLVDECQRVPNQLDAISRTLSILVLYLQEVAWQRVALQMLETLGKGYLPQLIVVPTLVRGRSVAHPNDLKTLRAASNTFAPAIAYGLTVSIGEDLTAFGRMVMMKARMI